MMTCCTPGRRRRQRWCRSILETARSAAFDSTTNPNVAKFDIPGDAQRQAGSSFKPFGLMAAMMYNHIDPETTQYSTQQPFQWQLCLSADPSCTWTVYNAEPEGGGNLNLHYAMDGSVNVVFARLNVDIGGGEQRSGWPTSSASPRASISAGAVEHPRHRPGIAAQHGRGVSTFAARRHPPRAAGDHQGAVLQRPGRRPRTPDRKPGKRVIPTWAATEMNSILKDNVTCAVGVCTGGAAQL